MGKDQDLFYKLYLIIPDYTIFCGTNIHSQLFWRYDSGVLAGWLRRARCSADRDVFSLALIGILLAKMRRFPLFEIFGGLGIVSDVDFSFSSPCDIDIYNIFQHITTYYNILQHITTYTSNNWAPKGITGFQRTKINRDHSEQWRPPGKRLQPR